MPSPRGAASIDPAVDSPISAPHAEKVNAPLLAWKARKRFFSPRPPGLRASRPWKNRIFSIWGKNDSKGGNPEEKGERSRRAVAPCPADAFMVSEKRIERGVAQTGQRTCLGSRGSEVQILSPRPEKPTRTGVCGESRIPVFLLVSGSTYIAMDARETGISGGIVKGYRSQLRSLSIPMNRERVSSSKIRSSRLFSMSRMSCRQSFTSCAKRVDGTKQSSISLKIRLDSGTATPRRGRPSRESLGKRFVVIPACFQPESRNNALDSGSPLRFARNDGLERSH